MNAPATGEPTISGITQVGETLTAVTSLIMDANGLTSPGYTYQWIRVDGTDINIPRATNTTYTLGDADNGKPIKVRMRFTDDDGYSAERTSAATAAVSPPPSPRWSPSPWRATSRSPTDGLHLLQSPKRNSG